MIGMPRVLSIPDSDDVLVLDDAPDPPEYYQRVLRCRPDGTIAWTAAPPTNQPDDAWTTVHLQDNQVSANSWSCFRVTLDLATGAETERVFTK